MSSSDGVTRFVTTMMGIVIGLTFLFGFGNVLALARRIGVPVYVAPLVAPTVDLTVLGLLVGTRHLAMQGALDQVLQPARRLLLGASTVTLALNVADPVCAGQWGKAAFDAVGPLLLIGWAEVGPALLQGLQHVDAVSTNSGSLAAPLPEVAFETAPAPCQKPVRASAKSMAGNLDDGKLERARVLNLAHWNKHKRPISAETLRRELRVGATMSRDLCAIVRSEGVPHARAANSIVL
jgi:hypothetical protein